MVFSKKFVCEGRERSTFFSHVAAPVFRKSFLLETERTMGQLTICALGFYELFVNGEKITKGALAPYISNPDHYDYYDLYDISPYLQQGENVIGIMLGDGFTNGKTNVWDFEDNVFNASPKLAVSVEITDGEKALIFDAEAFHCKKGPVWFNDMRAGVFYDKRLEEKGWNAPGFTEDGGWHAPIKAECPRGKAKLCEAEPIKVIREIKPVSITEGRITAYQPRKDVADWLQGKVTVEGPTAREGGYIYDFGENNAGIFRLKIKGTVGQRIDIQCAEQKFGDAIDYNNLHFFPDGYVQRDIYIVGSSEEEVYEPLFTYHGYRYLYVSGITKEQATEDLLTYLVMSSDLEERGGFYCSDGLTNQLYEMCLRSDSSNFYYFPTDCPHREKNGWTGDAAVSAEHMLLTRGAEKSFREWLHNIRAAQTESGQLPGIVPTDTWSNEFCNGPAWDRVLFELPYRIWQYRGETDVILENAHAMLRYLELVSRKRDEKGIIAYGLGDWVPVDREASDYQAPLGFTDSVMVYDICRHSVEMFEAVGLSDSAAFARRLGAEVLKAVRKEYLLPDLTVKSACQSAQAIGIYFDVFTEAEKPEAFRRLKEILKMDDYKITCGFLGFRTLFHVLAQFGEAERAFKMISGPEYPSYGYLAQNGWTTIPEQFYGDERMYQMSQNHHFLCDIEQWYLRYPGGINVIDSTHVRLQPIFLEKLTFAEAFHKLPAGEVRVKWTREKAVAHTEGGEESIRLEIRCPEEVSCEINLEGGWYFASGKNTYLGKLERKSAEFVLEKIR